MGGKRRKQRKQSGARNAAYLGFVAVCLLFIALLWPSDVIDQPTAPVQDTPAPATSAPTLRADPDPTPTPLPTPEPTPTPKPTPVSITISAAGDFTLGGDSRSGTLSAFDSVWKKQGPDYFMENLKPIFEQDDLTIVNLEGPLTESKKSNKNEFVFHGRPEYAQILSSGNIELCNLANNHSADYGERGYLDTQAALDTEGIGYFGYEQTYITTVKGVKIGFCGYRIWVGDLKDAVKTIKALREECDLVIASFHWGTEKQYEPNKKDIDYGHAAVEAGADLVLGHHPHVVGAIERYQGAYIVYSLGNCCFGGSRNPFDEDAMVFQQTFLFDNGVLSDGGINVIPIRTSSSASKNNYQPIVLEDSDADRVYKKIEKAGRKLKETAEIR